MRHRLPLPARSSEPCSARLVLRLHGPALSVPVQLGLGADASRRAVLRLNRRGRAVLSDRGSFPLTLVARAVDPPATGEH